MYMICNSVYAYNVPLCIILCRETSHERMYDEQQLDETQSAHSIGVVENPLYADEEGGFEPSFATLSAKEKEAEVSATATECLITTVL